MRLAPGIFSITLAVVLSGAISWAQAAPPAPKTSPDVTPPRPAAYEDLPEQTIYLKNVTQPSDANEIATAVRNTLPPGDRSYLVLSSNAIVIRANPVDLALAQKIVADLDRPRKAYRLTYTVTEMDGGKRVHTQHFSMIVTDGQRMTLKQGSRVPVATGSSNPGTQMQFTYIDVGMNFEATVSTVAGGGMLKSKVEQSGVADKTPGAGENPPVIRQTTLEGTSILSLGKPLMLGSVDILGSTAHLDIEVVMEPML